MIQTARQPLLRPALAADLPAIVALERAAHKYPWSEDLLRRELSHEWSTVLLAFAQEQVDGQASVERIAAHIIFWIVHDEIHILNVATAPEQRRRGYGRALMEEAEARGRAKGAVLSTLEVRKSNEAALALYGSLGYRQVGMRPRYYVDDDEDALVLLKNLSGGR
jgi:ribosomal-protein-alanine N-acetyltransferase